MDPSASNEFLAHRPGAVSVFFIYKAALFAAGFWGWLTVLAIRDTPLSSWHVVAAAGAITTTLVGVVLGGSHALARNAAVRHEQVMRTLVDISWQSFAPSTKDDDANDSDTNESAAMDGDADVIRLARESRPRPRH